MSSSLSALLTVLGRWPRRLAAFACLLLAAAAAFTPRRSAAAPQPDHRVGRGEVAVPVLVSGVDARTYLHPGEWVDLLAGPGESGVDPAAPAALVAQRVRLLSIVAPQNGAAGGALVVAADRATALRVAALGERTVLAVGHDPP